MICKILGLFVNSLSADDKYSLLNRDNLLQHIQMHLSQKPKIFAQFLFTFSKFRFNFENFQKKDDPHSWCIFELMESEKLGYINSPFRRSLDKWHGKQAETLLKAKRQHLYYIYWSMSREFRLKKSLWVLELFFNPLTADEKNSLVNRGNLLQHFHMQLSQNCKTFSDFFFFFFLHFLNLDSILKIFKKRMTLQAHVFLNLRSQKNVVRKMYRKSRFRGPFDKYHGK